MKTGTGKSGLLGLSIARAANKKSLPQEQLSYIF